MNAHLRAGDSDRVRLNAATVHPNPTPKRTSCFWPIRCARAIACIRARVRVRVRVRARVRVRG